MTKFGKNISRIRKVMKLTQKMLAHDADINYRHYQDIEGDKADIRLSTATEIAKILKVPVSMLFHENINVDLIKTGIQSFYDLLGKLPAGIIVMDPAGKIIYVNRYFVENLTYRTEEEILQNLHAWDLFPVDEQKEAKERFAAFTNNPPHEPKPARRSYLGPGQKPIMVGVSWQYLKSAGGEIIGIICTVTPEPA